MVKHWLLLWLILTLCSCNGYRPVSLPQHVVEIETTQLNVVDKIKTADNEKIDEDKAIKLALSFNPEIRTPIIRDRGWGDREVQLRGIVRPELDVSQDDAQVLFNVDVLILYNLLSSEERRAWREMRHSEREQIYAEQKGATILLTRDVRLSFLELALIQKKISIVERKLFDFTQYKEKINNNVSPATNIILNLF